MFDKDILSLVVGSAVCASGSVSHALTDKAKKVFRPLSLMRAIAKFDHPTCLSNRLFSIYIFPIILYYVENWGNWGILSDKNVHNRDEDHIFYLTNSSSRCNAQEISEIYFQMPPLITCFVTSPEVLHTIRGLFAYLTSTFTAKHYIILYTLSH